ncbi:MAG: glucosaminidase domain-containing protein [Hyphomicrobium sp.]
MKTRIRARYALVLAAMAPVAAEAASLPEIKLSSSNTVPECATPGRLTAFLESRNSRLDARFSAIAADYMRIGEELNIRWDTAFFQMLLETGNLTFTGDVSAKQNNFAGLGATGRKAPGESFADVQTGVKAHLEHLLMYAGEKVDNPVAERTRKVQEWGVLTNWHQSIKSPMTYSLIAQKWAPGSRSYVRDIANVSDAFYDGVCKGPDPKPEMMALAHPEKGITTAAVSNVAPDASSDRANTLSGADLARRAVEEARASGSFVRSNLGASSLAQSGTQPVGQASMTQQQLAVTILNAPKVEPATVEAPVEKTVSIANAPISEPPSGSRVEVAALGAGTKAAVAAAPEKAVQDKTAGGKCKVWTASYGGGRAVIIKASAEQQDNYTVLDVNEGAEKREADAYIAAYAKGGETVGEFSNPTQALDKAFELCPEG